jgi:pilus assembly protein Flp/PilA
MFITYALIMVQNFVATLKRDEGQGMAEYGLILALVAVAVVLAFTFLGTQISTLIANVGDQLQPAP